MTITFESDKDIILYTLKKIISLNRDNQYLFGANCVWWIAGIIGLDEGLTIYIDLLEVRRKIGVCEVSTVSRDIRRSLSAESQVLSPDNQISNEKGYVRDPSRRTRKGRVNPLPKTKRQLNSARKALAKKLKRHQNFESAINDFQERITLDENRI